MTLQHIQDSNSHSEEPALEARPADVVEAESYRWTLWQSQCCRHQLWRIA